MGRPKKIKIAIKEENNENLFKGKCVYCNHKIKKERTEITVNVNMFGDEYSFMCCPKCNGNMSIRLTVKDPTE